MPLKRFSTAISLSLIILGITSRVLSQVPASGHIITVEAEKQQVYLDIGSEDGVNVGDNFIAYTETKPQTILIRVNEVIEAHIATGTFREPHNLIPSEGDALIPADKAGDCLICHYKSEPRWRREPLHAPSALSPDCRACHGSHQPTGEEPKTSAQVECQRCHPITLNGTSGHQVFLQAGCTSCHSIHATDNQKTREMEKAGFCESCHPLDKETTLQAHNRFQPVSGKCHHCHDPHDQHEGKYLYAQKHSPFEDASCDECHPKGEQPEKMTETAVSKICYNCHDEFSEVKGKLHAPVLSGSCTACHSPHASNREFFLKETAYKLCLNCHPLILTGKNKHQPTKTGQCLTCHAPHQSEEPKLLRQPLGQLCAQCHKKLVLAVSKHSHEPFAQKNCTTCHTPHSTDLKHLFKTKPDQTCQDCHTDLEKKTPPRHQKMYNKPVPRGFPRNGYRLTLTDQEQITCYTCHEPHVSENDKLLRERKETICALCHSEHWMKSFTK